MLKIKTVKKGAELVSVKTDDIEKVYSDLDEIVSTGKVENPYRYLGLKG